MIKRIILFLFILLFAKTKSQNFIALPYLDNGIGTGYLERVLFDSIHDKLIVSGKDMNYAGGKKVRGICSWNGNIWDSLRGGINTHDILSNQPNGVALCGIPYNGKFLVGGVFESIGGVNASALATWDGSKWDSLPTRAFKFLDYGGIIYNFINFNSKFYLCGLFDTIQGVPANNLATYNGTSFQPVPIPITSVGGITDMKVYNGDLYVSGVFSYSFQPSNRHILRFDGTNWYSVGGSVKGSISNIASMAIYNNELYVGGFFLKTDGNVADIIMKWDGTTWKDVGWGSMYQNGGIWKLLVYHSKLYAFGTFNKAANQKASKLAVFDGINWCTYPDSVSSDIMSATIYHDSIYIAGAFRTIAGDTAKKYIAKITKVNNFNQCVNIGIKGYENLNSGIIFYPNPVSNILFISTEQNEFENSEIEITNTLGQTVLKLHYSNEIDVSELAQGVYNLRITTQNNHQFHAKLIKQ